LDLAAIKSIAFAMLEKGLQFGNNGDPPDKLTSDIMDSSGDSSWPISTFTYIIIRNGLQSDRLREGATCANVQATVEFWHWLVLSTKASSVEFASPVILTGLNSYRVLSSEIASDVIERNYFVPLPDLVSLYICRRESPCHVLRSVQGEMLRPSRDPLIRGTKVDI
jgi:hypothetical protein